MSAVLGGMLACGVASASTIQGRVTGAPIPAADTGRAFVRAVSLLTGVVTAADDTDAVGRYRVTVPKGAYALFPAIIRPGKLFRPAPTKVRIRTGKRKTVSVPARRTSAVQRHPIVAVPDGAFTGGTGPFAVLNRGMGAMIITDLVSVAPTPSCRITVREVSAQYVAAYNQELALVRRGLVDPATAIRPGRQITPTRGVRGRITVTGDRMRIDADVYKWGNKRTIGRTRVEGPATTAFELEQALVPKIATLLCDQPRPYSGTFSGALDYSANPGAQNQLKVAWTGDIVLTADAAFISQLPPRRRITASGRARSW